MSSFTPPTRLDYVAHDASEALREIAELEERLKRVEYIIRRIEEIKPDLAETSCAGCRFLIYGTRIGKDAPDGKISLCAKRIKRGFLNERDKEADGSGCYEWESRHRCQLKNGKTQ